MREFSIIASRLVISSLGKGEHIWIQYLIKPTGDEWQKKGQYLIDRLIGKRNAKASSGTNIPEEVFQITSVGTKKTMEFRSPLAHFTYRHIKPPLFFGYRLLGDEGGRVLLADPEKAILDYLYLHPHLKTADDFRGMRFNEDEFHQKVNIATFRHYLASFASKALAKRAQCFLTIFNHDQS